MISIDSLGPWHGDKNISKKTEYLKRLFWQAHLPFKGCIEAYNQDQNNICRDSEDAEAC